MIISFLKNPIVIGFFAGVATYLYLLWSLPKKTKNSDKKKHKKKINLLIPVVVAILCGFIAYYYFGDNSTPNMAASTAVIGATTPILANNIQNQTGIIDFPQQQINSALANFKVSCQMSDDTPAQFHLLSRGVNIPHDLKIPDVFISAFQDD